MLQRSPWPARQLKSVSSRYGWGRLPREDGGSAALQQRRYWLPGQSRARTTLAARAENGRDHRLQRLEAVLYLARDPLTTRKLGQYANLADGTEARTLIRRLNELYDRTGRAFRVERVAGGYQLLTRPQFAAWVRRLEHVPREVRLSAPALETLAVIAYRQPVLRADIEAIRGVSCGEILRQLMERDLVRIGGRSEELGRPYYYATTKRFLCLFGLETLDQLPRAAALRPGGEGATTGPGGQPGGQNQIAPGEIRAGEEAGLLEEESKMPMFAVSTRKVDPSTGRSAEDEVLQSQRVAAFDDDHEEVYEDYDDEEDDDDDEEEGDDDGLDDEDVEEDEDFDDEDFEEEEEDIEADEDLEADEEDIEDEEWEEVGEEDEELDEDEAEEEWEEDDSDWDYDDEDDEDDEDEEEEADEDWE